MLNQKNDVTTLHLETFSKNCKKDRIYIQFMMLLTHTGPEVRKTLDPAVDLQQRYIIVMILDHGIKIVVGLALAVFSGCRVLGSPSVSVIA